MTGEDERRGAHLDHDSGADRADSADTHIASTQVAGSRGAASGVVSGGERGARTGGIEDGVLAPGELLGGRYELLAMIGRGGMGTVYRARDCELDEIVAVKTLRPGVMAQGEAVARFRREVKLARRITHPNVARTFDIGEHAGAKFFTMEFVPGESLGSRIERRGALPAREAIDVGRKIASALAAAHALDIVHRDLKPDNVLLASDGRVVVTDFGIARAIGDGGARVTTAGLLGTPAYMAPEQVEASDVDGRADVYALGEILYEMLTGAPAWEGTSPFSVAVARLQRPPPDPRDRVRSIDPALASIVVRALARSREARPTAGEMYDALEPLLVPPLASRGNVKDLKEESALRVSVLPLPRASSPGPLGAHDPRRPGLTGDGAATIAVLPFMSGSEDTALAFAVTEELIDALCTVPRLRAVPHGAVLEAAARIRDPRALGDELGAAVVAVGKLRVELVDGRRVLAASVKLISVEDGFQIGAARARREVGDLAAVAEELAHAISAGLEVRFRAATKRLPLPAEALELYWKAREALQESGRAESLRAIDALGRALVIAPDSPELLATLATAHARLFAFFPEFDASLEVARDAVARAIELGPDLGEAHFANAALLVGTGDAVDAMKELRLAISQNPRIVDAHVIAGELRIAVGHVDRGIAAYRKALALDPLRLYARYRLAYALALIGDHEGADELLAPGPTPETLQNYWIAKARILALRRDGAEASRLLALGTPRGPGCLYLEILGGEDPAPRVVGVDRMGRQGASLERIDRFARVRMELAALAFDFDRVLAELSTVDAAACHDVTWFCRCALLDPIRHEPAFLATLARVEERAAAVRAVDPALD